MELEDKISGRNVTDEMTKKKHKNEERKMRIKYEHSVNYLKSQGEILMDKISFEETKSKDVLDEKLKLEQELIDMKEDMAKEFEKDHENRENLIKLRVKNSQLETQDLDQIEEEKTLVKENEELLQENTDAEKLNIDLKRKITETI